MEGLQICREIKRKSVYTFWEKRISLLGKTNIPFGKNEYTF
jgi:hypothetical protein